MVLSSPMLETSLATQVIAAALEEARRRCMDRVQGIHHERYQAVTIASSAVPCR